MTEVTTNAGAGAPTTAAAGHKRSLWLALSLTGTLMVAEIIGGLWTGSLALLADAAHMFTDVGGMILALIAIRFGERPATPRNTFGYVRMEVLSALANATVLLLMTVYILYEAYQRFFSPTEILGLPMLAVATVGLIANMISMRLLAAGSSSSLNIKGAYLEVMGDLLGSIGVIIAAVAVMLTGWKFIDPLVGAGIGLFIVPRAWILLKQATHILMEGTPPNIDLKLLESELRNVPDVMNVRDLHVWSLTSGIDSMSCHLVISDMAFASEVLDNSRKSMKTSFGLSHTTIEIESIQSAQSEERLAL